ncbi:MAG: LysM peptidoglycan-binding domain-containing protein [Anaerolineaceae bacterium]
MSPENSNTKVCPTCGTRLSENATRCLVCGRNFSVSTPTKTTSSNPVESPRLPELKLSLPAALGLIVLILALGAAIVFLILQTTGRVASPTATPTLTLTPTNTLLPKPTTEPTLAPTFTPLPPIDYTVQSGDLCSGLAAYYNVSIDSIKLLNNLDADCTLYPGVAIKIPQPTPTATAQPTGTLSAADATSSACQTVPYTVTENDTLSSISLNYSISVESIKNFNNLPNDFVWAGQRLNLPLCERLPTEGPTPTPTTPPAYPAANLLLPNDGIVYSNSTDTITLQWSSVGVLRENEAYLVTIEDVTSTGAKRVVQYVKDTKVNVPLSLRPVDNTSHIFRWWVVVAIQTGSNADGTPIYLTNGATSSMRVFGWTGTSGGTNPTTAP